MPGTQVAPPDHGPGYNTPELRISRLEEDMREKKAARTIMAGHRAASPIILGLRS